DAVARSRDHCDPSSGGPASRLGTQLETSRLSMGYIGYRMSVPRALVLLCLSTLPSFGATFGTVVAHAQPLADLALDEARRRLYVVNTASNQVEVYSTATNPPRLTNTIK